MKIFYRIILSITAIALLTLTSCLDDEKMGTEVTRFDEVPDVVDFNEKPNSGGYVTRSFEGTTDPDYAQESTFWVNLSSPYTYDEDLVVTVEFDAEAVSDYVSENPGWGALAADKQDFITADIVIPAGERMASFTVNFYTEGLSADDRLMAAYSITNVSNPDVIISGNFGTQFVRVVVANVFEGTYDLSDNFWRNSGGTNYTAYMRNPVEFVTMSSTKSLTSYFYTGWGDVFHFDADINNPATIDGHANAYPVTVYTPGWGAGNQEQIDNYDGQVWNYCYQNGDGKWVFRICHDAGGWFGHAVYTQQ